MSNKASQKQQQCSVSPAHCTAEKKKKRILFTRVTLWNGLSARRHRFNTFHNAYALRLSDELV
jgi:hypothetical protein